MGGMYMVQHVYTTTTSASRSTLACPVTSRNDLRVLMQVQDSAACQRQSLTDGSSAQNSLFAWRRMRSGKR